MAPPEAEPAPDGPTLLSAIVNARGADVVAEQIGVTEGSVRHWASRRVEPRAPVRKIMARELGIPLTATWGERKAAPTGAASAPASPSSPELEAAGTTAKSALDLAREQVHRLLRRIDKADADGQRPQALASLEKSLSTAIKELATLSGEREASEATILRSEKFRDIMARVFEAAKPYPEAVAAITRALEAGRR